MASVTVSLGEVLELRGEPLNDGEIWALLNQAAETLLQHTQADASQMEAGPVFVINPDTLSMTSGGQVTFGEARVTQQYGNYMAPETEDGTELVPDSMSSTELLYVYALGKSLIYSSEYGLQMEEPNTSRKMSKPVRISEGLESLLRSMTNRNPSKRATLRRVAEVCNAQNEREKRGLRRSFSKTVTDLYNSILGPDTQEEDMAVDEVLSSRSTHGVQHGVTYAKVSPREITSDRSHRRSHDQRSHDLSRQSYDHEQKLRDSRDHERKSRDYKHRSHDHDRRSHDLDRSHDSGSRRRRRTSPEQYRLRSRSRSRSRSPQKQKHGRESDSPDSGYHRNGALGAENSQGRYSRPDLANPSAPYHLNDITNSASLNGHHHNRQSSSGSHHSRSSGGKSGPPSQQAFESAAFRKYLKIKERQKKLRILRQDLTSDDASDELSDIVAEHLSETRSVRSMGSNVGVYHPELHMRYGSNSALRLGRDSDKDSVVSSDASVHGPETQAFRAISDISDPFITQLQQLTAAQPPIMSSQATPTPQAPPRKHRKQSKKPSSPRQQKKAAASHPEATTPSSPQKPQTKPREYYGPDFVYRANKPIHRMLIPLTGESLKNPGHVCRVVVVLLNGQKLEAMVDPSLTGSQLYEAVRIEFELPEFYFFGLTYVNSDNEHCFISPETKLHKVAPDGWKESWKREVAPITFTVNLRVKYYVNMLPVLRHETPRHQLYLQLRRDILEERCLCDEEQTLHLAGLAMQAEYGDYMQDSMGRNYFIPEHYFPERMVKRLGTGYIKDHAPDAHRQMAGLEEVEAQMEFIKYVQENVPEYGTHFYKLLKKKGEVHNIIWVGVNLDNLVLAENTGNSRIIVHKHPWSSLEKISFNRRRFSVKPKPDLGQIAAFKMNFYTTSYKKSQYLLKFCLSQHSFKMKIRDRLAACDSGAEMSQSEHMSIGEADHMHSLHSDYNQTITEENGSHGSRASRHSQEMQFTSTGFLATDDVPQKLAPSYRYPPPYKPETSASMLTLQVTSRENQPTNQPVARSVTVDNVNASPLGNGLTPNGAPNAGDSATDLSNSGSEAGDRPKLPKPQLDKLPSAYVIDMSIPSNDRTLFPSNENETVSDSLLQRFNDELLSPETLPGACERTNFEVVLNNSPTQGIGINIVEGGSAENFGIFVKSVKVFGQAHRNGQIKPGDQILAINGTVIRTKHEAAELIKGSADQVRLLISQVKPPRSIKRQNSGSSDDAVFQWKLNNSLNVKDFPIDQTDSGSSKNSSFVQNDHDTECKDMDVNSPICNNTENIDKNGDKNTENDKTNEKYSVDEVDRCKSIPVSVDEKVDHERVILPHVAVHSMTEQDLSANSGVEASASGARNDRIGRYSDDESLTDSEFEEVLTAVIDNTYHSAAPSHGAVTTPQLGETGRANPTPEVFEVFVEKHQMKGFGLNVTGGVNTSVRHGGIYVKSLIKDSPAHREGSIRKGDRILQVDSVLLTGFTHKQAVETLCNAPPFCKLVIERSALPQKVPQRSDPPLPDILQNGHSETREEQGQPQVKVTPAEADIYSTFVTEDNSYSVQLNKGTYGLGFSTVGGHQGSDAELHEKVVRIKRVFPIGPAADNGHIRPGDVILAVNGRTVEGKSHNETMVMLRGAGKNVQLLLCHPDPDVLPPLAHLDSEESQQITPSGSISCVSDTDSDTDSDVDTLPRREALITPPTGFAPSPIPLDSLGNLLPRIVSPPPPLPVSPPPSLMGTLGGDSQGSDTPRGEDYEVQVGVAELMDSCQSELVLLHNAKNASKALPPVQLNSSLIVREDSALTVQSGDVTPVIKDYSRETTPVTQEYSREATPSVDIAGDVTPVYDQMSEKQSDLNDTGGTNSESAIDSNNGTLESFASGAQMDKQAHAETESDYEHSESGNNETTSFETDPRLGTDSGEMELTGQSFQNSLETSPSGTFNVKSTEKVKKYLDASGNIESVNAVNTDSDVREDNVNKDSDLDGYNNDDQSSDDSDDEFDDDDIKLLEKKYLAQEKDEDIEHSDVNYDDVLDNDDIQESSDDDNDIDYVETRTDLSDIEAKDLKQFPEILNGQLDDQLNEGVRDNLENQDETSKCILNASISEDEDKTDSLFTNELKNKNLDLNQCIEDTDIKNVQLSDLNEDTDKYISDDKDDYQSDERVISEDEDDLGDKSDDDDYNKNQGNIEPNGEVEQKNGKEPNEILEPGESDLNSSTERESLSPSLTTESAPLKPGEFSVTLTRPEGRGLGFTVAGGASTTGGCYVKAVLQSPALDDGRLKSGDKLIMVDGVDMRPLNHFEAVSVLRQAGDTVTIVAYRPSLDSGDTRQAGVEKSPRDQTARSHIYKVDSREDPTQEREVETESDSETEALNVSQQLQDLAEQLTSELDAHGPEGVQLETKANAESSTDTMRSLGEQVFQPVGSGSEEDSDSQPEGDGPLQDLIQSLEASKTQLRPREERTSLKSENFWQDKTEKETLSSPEIQSPVEPSVYHIDLEKPVSGGLGISLVTYESPHQTGVVIRTIKSGGAADTDGRLEVGDKILQINGESLIGMNHTKAANILRNSQGKLSLTVSRRKGKSLDNKQLSNRLSQGTSATQFLAKSSGHESSTDDDYSGLCDSSLSLTKHVPSDINDDSVDDLVAQAERILATADVKSDGYSESEESEAPPLPEKKSTRKTSEQTFLPVREMIDYQQDQLVLESDDSDENDLEPLDRTKFYANIDLDNCWADGLRTLDITVPEEVTADWLFQLPLVTIPDGTKSSIPNVIARLQDKIEIDDPQSEFKQLRNVPVTDECDAACLPYNRGKNRFRNVLPFDVNRVLLSDDPGTDYINASHIHLDVAGAVCDYIVTQGPLPDTTSDFWAMVWQQEVTVIVMLTRDMEAMKVKCHRYWPDTADAPIDVCNGQLRLSLLYTNSLEDFDIHSLLVEDTETGDSRHVYHLNYTSWPDHGTLMSALPLLQCMRLSHLLRSRGPMIVHCSAGIGRSGTFITIDVALAHVERGLQFDIAEIVRELRRQRQGMIQTRDQYLFCYTACVEALLDTPT